ncbi:MAG: hypothetical protein PVF33_04105 [Candidatus Latescibacterota bacterium]|jgi:hypothetical protein
MMKSLGLSVFVLVTAAFPARAQTNAVRKDEVKYFQLSIWRTAQVYDRKYSIHGARLALYGSNRDLFGLDAGLAVENTRDMKGFQWGFIAWARRDCSGWQNAVVGVVKRNMTGFQSGVFNGAKVAKGFQLGLFNMTTEAAGLQVGLINKATWLSGLQIGLLNIATDNDSHPILPIINWRF